ncbi:hypothetical protein SAMD00019534_021700 [Acytostelium subglobosum LB1]|uniref:hypothetical protein n=1 Tax=Acytostelium subglobosum LB1 TaxID=1410327 RepID=UPI000644970D|nr:hypothetical protein SAMD00019534_021700 [Acytostelium subglobosum LB1]GAM18995.1 hypothetical protein SAMD00019534_021700 [Acytostelium subglobosum LB1]|eukprot:XP_012756922.1 hypothetical protein SAMD00019534_021700 [Acytostelium subglobosum LB1]
MIDNQENIAPKSALLQQQQAPTSSLITKSMVIRPNTNAPITDGSSSSNDQTTPQIIVKETIYHSNGRTSFKDYLQGEFLGLGGFAKCYVMTDLDTKKVYAAKIVPKSSLVKARTKNKLKSEIKIHSSLHHDNIVSFEHCFEDDENVYILLGLCNQKTMMDLHKRRKILLEAEVKYYVYQVIQAVRYLHQNKIIHRDLKLGNLFINDMSIKLGDFGLSTRIEHDGERKKTICGTPNYIAPEILENKNGHSYEVDVWSIGVIIYTLLVGKPPFETSDVRNTYQRIRKNQYSFPEDHNIAESAKQLINSILTPIPEKRPNLNQILEHDFFTLSSIPKYLPPTALIMVPIIRSTPLAENTNIVNQQRPHMTSNNVSPSKPPRGHQSPLKKLPSSVVAAAQMVTLSPNSQQKLSDIEKDDFHFRKLRRLEKMKENDLKIQLLKQKMVDTTQQQQQQQEVHRNVESIQTGIAKSHISEPVPKEQSRPATTSTTTTTTASTQQIAGSLPRSLVFVDNYADFSNKYGIGYSLSNGSYGAYYNDSTKVISFLDSGLAHYMEHAKGTEGDGRRILSTLETHPHDTQKKLSLVKYFSNYFQDKPRQPSILINELKQRPNSTADINNPVYVKKWIKTAKAIAFRLSDKTIQVNFIDKSIILINRDQVVTYVASDECTTKTDHLNNFLSSSHDGKIISRIKYVKEILINLYHKRPQDDMI